jgi:hypothetical protein
MNIDIDEHLLAEFDQRQISLNASLAIEPERVAHRPGLQVLQFLREHAIEEIATIIEAAGDAQRAAMRAVEDGRPAPNGSVFQVHFAIGRNELATGFFRTVREVLHGRS